MEHPTLLMLPHHLHSLPSSPPSSPLPSLPSPRSPRPPSATYRIGISISNPPPAHIRDDAWSCLVILLTFWFFASMTLILGFYGSVDLVLCPNSSQVLQANSWFVQDIKVRAEEESKHGPMLYGFLETPPLDVLTSWSESRNVSVPPMLSPGTDQCFHQEWVYFLNKGSEIEIYYDVKSHESFPLILVIAEGKEDLMQWIEKPSHPNTTFSWSLIHGSGKIQQTIQKCSNYYIAVGNLNSIEIEVELTFNIQATMYNTTPAYYRCSLDHWLCTFKLFLQRNNVAILTTPAPETVKASQIDKWYVKLSYGPRWVTYFVGSGMMTLLIFMAFQLSSNLGCIARDETAHDTTERRPLLSNKDDDEQSLGSSYESVSFDEEEIGESLGTGSLMPKDGEIDNFQHLCTVCCDALRDSFFLPCGHCVVCFSCGTRILDEAGSCPICGRKIKKVRKIFTV